MPCVAVGSSPTTANSLSPQPPPSSYWMAILNFQPEPRADHRSSAAPGSSESSSKRKRPAMKIQIPKLCYRSLVVPVEDVRPAKTVDELEGKGLGFAVYCKRGRRSQMEDRFSASVQINGDPKQAMFCVFDGHGGSKAAEFAASRMGINILNRVAKCTTTNSSSSSCGEDPITSIEDAIRDAYLATDSEFLVNNSSPPPASASASAGGGGGSCCVTALIRDGYLVVSNAGDCRAVLSRGGIAKALTVDHRPDREDEQNRIQSMGGYVDCCNGVWRIQSSLAVSRSIGDAHLKKWVTAEPETTTLRIDPDCNFLILASDGVWDKVTNQEAVDTVLTIIKQKQTSSSSSSAAAADLNLSRACRELVDLSIRKGSYDDASAMVILLNHFAP